MNKLRSVAAAALSQTEEPELWPCTKTMHPPTLPTHTFTVDFIGEKKISVAEGESILHAALKAGIPHYHSCGGQARCSTCRVVVTQGAEAITPVSGAEAALRQRLPFPGNVRMACQTFVTDNNVAVHRIIRDPSDLALYVDDSETGLDELGEEKDLVLLFLDIRDFTPFMESYLPFDVMHLLRKLFGIFRTCIEKYGGTIIETAGDGLYAVFGLKSDASAIAADALTAGKTIFHELEIFNAEYVQPHFRHRFQIGIGLHRGKAIVGNIGLGINNNLTVMGLPVNIASRIQAATKDLNNSFLVSEAVVQDGEEAGYASSVISMKGLSNPVRVYLLGAAYYPASAFASCL